MNKPINRSLFYYCSQRANNVDRRMGRLRRLLFFLFSLHFFFEGPQVNSPSFRLLHTHDLFFFIPNCNWSFSFWQILRDILVEEINEMELVVDLVDPYIFEPLYTNVARLIDPTWTVPPASNPYRFFLSTYFVLWWGATLLYLSCAGLSWVFLFDKNLRKDKFFLPNQEILEMKVSFIIIALQLFIDRYVRI